MIASTPIRLTSAAQTCCPLGRRRHSSSAVSPGLISALAILWLVSSSLPGCAQTAPEVPLDSVVAVVNRQVILSSDIDDDIQLSVLDPAPGAKDTLTRQRALQELISRALIQQQIRQEDLPAIQPSSSQVTARLEEIRKQLPACVRAHCDTQAGWKAFLAEHDLTQYRVQAYLRNRMEILRFIEERFRQGIQITPQQIENYYHDTLLPQYPAGASVPPLRQVASRIEEILLEQQVNVLFDNWLDNLRGQGNVEIVDPALRAAQETAGNKVGSQ